MAASKAATNHVIVRPGMTIGSVAAETDDEFLYECFIDHPAVVSCQNIKSAGMIAAGRTGSGKTAILKHIERASEHAIHIDPSEMALSYVSNSDTLRFVEAIGGDLDLLFLALWKHVLCIEFIRLKFSVNDEEKSRKIFGRFWERFTTDQRKRKSLAYLKDWQGKFWISMDQNIKEITEKYEKGLQSEFGSDLAKFKAGGQYDKRLSTERKSELVSRARKIINADRLSELAGVIDMLSDLSTDEWMTTYYILIDELDKRWVDDNIRFKLIRALIESLKQFRRIQNLKILVALRSDVLERVVQETGDIGFQREKYEDYFVRIRWSPAQLRDLVEQRIQLTFRRQYSNAQAVRFIDIFPHKVNNSDCFDYMLERTLMRPRDIIIFVNECLKVAENRPEVTASQVLEAEGEFSRGRRQSLEYEWRSAFPSLPRLLDYLKGIQRGAVLKFSDLCAKDSMTELVLQIAEKRVDFDPLYLYAQRVCQCQMTLEHFMREVVDILYRVGAVGLKPSPQDRYYYSYIDQPVMEMSGIRIDSRVKIHQMLHRAMGIEFARRR